MTRARILTPALQEAIIEGVKGLLGMAAVADLCGIGKTTIYEWLRKGEADLEAGVESDYANIAYAIKKQESKNQKELLERIKSAGLDPKTWTANGWLLERKWRTDFGANAHDYEVFQKQIDEIKQLLLGKEKGVVENG